MKRKFLGLTIGLLAAVPMFVNADEVDNTKFNDCVTSTETKTCTLKENIEIANTVEVTGNIVLDLAGYEITSDITTAIKVTSGSLTVKDTSTESTGKIEVSGEAFRMGTKGNANDDKDSAVLTIEKGVDVVSTGDACVVIYAGTLNTAGNLTTKAGNFATIQGSGNDHGTVINVTDGSVSNATQVAIFQPQNGTVTIDGGTITGTTGVEVRAGNLVVNDGAIISNVDNTTEVTVKAEGSGSTTTGVGVAVAQHTTKLPINVVINGGTIQGLSALYESNPQKNSTEDIAKIKITVKGGVLETTNEGNKVVYSENNLITLEGGEFSGELSENIATPEGSDVYQVLTTEGEIKYVVAEETEVEEGYFGLGFTKEGFEEVFNNQEDYEEVMGLIEEKLAKKYNAAIYYEMIYGGLLNGNLIADEKLVKTELDKAIEVKLDIPETLEKVKDGYTRKYVVIRVHYNEETQKYETDVLDVKEVKDGKVTFETDKFSTYVLAYEDTKAATNPETFDGISLYMIITSVSLIGLVSLIAYSKKAKNY